MVRKSQRDSGADYGDRTQQQTTKNGKVQFQPNERRCQAGVGNGVDDVCAHCPEHR